MTRPSSSLRALVVLLLVLLSVSPLQASVTVLVSVGATWKYLDTGSNEGAAWRDPPFNDTAWAAGPAQLGYGDGGEATVVGYGPDANNKYVTTYFRRAFNVTDAAGFTSLSLRVVRDDGVVVYLNGTEVYRNNMPSGTISHTTFASTAIGGTDESTFLQAGISPALLVEGVNVLAVEIHQSGANSSDISFDLELTGELPTMQITLNGPAHGATGVNLSPTLDVSVSHRNGLPMSVAFYGRPAPPVGPDFTIIPLPDTQFYSSSLNGGSPAIFNAQADWIVANKTARNIVFVTQLGDCVQNGDNGGNNIEWLNATNALYRLENPLTTFLTYGIPYGVAVGNHDQSPIGSATGTTTFYNQYFGEAHFAGRPYYGGHYGANNDDHFELFSASGLNFIAIHFEYDTAMTTNSPELDWANLLLQTYSDRQAIVISHWIMNSGENGSFSAQGQAIYNRLRVNPNLFLMLCGHVNPNGEGKRTDVFNGQTIYTVLSDYQDRVNGGNGWLRIMEFSPANSVIRVQTYSPTLNQFETDANSQFNLYYDMRSLVGDSFAAIAVNTGVSSGGTTALWADRTVSTDYEWYVLVSDGVETIASPIWQFRTVDQTVPAAPDALAANAQSSSEILLTWTDNASNEAGFEIQQSLDGVNYATIGTVAVDATNALVTALQPTTTYSYRVRAFNEAGYSAESNVASATTLAPPVPPAAPSGLTAIATSTSELTLNWTDNAVDETGYRLERSLDNVNFNVVTNLPADTSFHRDEGLADNTTYYYRVRAFNEDGQSAPAEVSGTTLALPANPPSNLSATTLSSSQIELAWTDNATNENGFRLERSTSGGAFAEIAVLGANVTVYSDSGLTPATAYSYRVRAFNPAGESAFAEASASTLPLPPPAPTGLMAATVSSSQIDLAWTDNAANETGFQLERSTGGGPFVEITLLGADATAYSDLGLNPATAYDYRVRAYNAGGASAYAGPASATTLPNPPAAPSGLSATAASATQINLSWVDNANSETAIEVERKIGAGGVWSVIATVAANSTSYSDTELTANTTYFYRARALNAGGYSGYSSEASATTAQLATVTFTSVASQDGYVLESSETSNAGGSATGNSTGTSGLRAGDNNQDRQYRGVVSFDTASIPDGAMIISATLRLKRGTVSGTNPFNTHGTCFVDIKGGTGFGGSTSLASIDFQAAADASQVASLSNAISNGDWSTGSLNAAGLLFINKTGTTQCRIHFQVDDDDDRGNDYIGWYAGDNSTSGNRPQLVIVYQ